MTVRRHTNAFYRRMTRLRYLLLAVILLLLFVLESLPHLIPSFYLGMPLMVIPMVCVIGLYEKETAGALFGLFTGMMLDCYSVQGGIYSTVVLFLLGGICGFLGRFIMTENFLSALSLSAGTLLIYLLGKWIVFGLILSANIDPQYLLLYSLPTFVYSLLFTVPLFWLVRVIHRIGQQEKTERITLQKF